MTPFKEKTFAIPPLKGISAKTIEEHLKLYSGYVKNLNSILEKIPVYEGYIKEDAFAPYVINELHRRMSFEFNGMRNHEYYFSNLEGEPIQLTDGGALKSEIEKTWGTFDVFLNGFKAMALTRGIGWAMLSYDKQTQKLMIHWVDEQHFGQLSGTQPILALDMWEHSYVADYQSSGKKQYVEDFFTNLNWSTCENNYAKALV